MKRHIFGATAVVLLSGLAFAGGYNKEKQSAQPQPEESQQQAAQPADDTEPATGGSGEAVQAGKPDWASVGPWTRKPTNERELKKEIEGFFKAEEQAMKGGDLNASLARIDFPILMTTDDKNGRPHSAVVEKDDYVKLMKPMLEAMPKDLEFKHKWDITVLSDSLATFTDDVSWKRAGMKGSGKSSGLLIKKDGQWKWKAMSEPGWGDYAPTGTGGSGDEGQSRPVDPTHRMPADELGTGGSGMEPEQDSVQPDPWNRPSDVNEGPRELDDPPVPPQER